MAESRPVDPAMPVTTFGCFMPGPLGQGPIVTVKHVLLSLSGGPVSKYEIQSLRLGEQLQAILNTCSQVEDKHEFRVQAEEAVRGRRDSSEAHRTAVALNPS